MAKNKLETMRLFNFGLGGLEPFLIKHIPIDTMQFPE